MRRARAAQANSFGTWARARYIRRVSGSLIRAVQSKLRGIRSRRALQFWGRHCGALQVSLLPFPSGDRVCYSEGVLSLPAVLVDDVVQYLDSILPCLTNCFRACEESFLRQVGQISSLSDLLACERRESSRLRSHIENMERVHDELVASFSERLASASMERDELSKSVSRFQGEAAFASESQRAAWTSLQQMAAALKDLQGKYSICLERVCVLQRRVTECSSHHAVQDSLLGRIEQQVERLIRSSEAASRQIADELCGAQARAAEALGDLRSQNRRLREQCSDAQAAFRISDEQHVLANMEVRKMQQRVREAEEKYAALTLHLDNVRMNGFARDIQAKMFLENVVTALDCRFDELDNVMVATRVAFNHDYQLIKATALDAVRVGRAIYKELRAAQDEQALACGELSSCRQRLVRAARAIAALGPRSARVGGGYDYVPHELLDLHSYAASSWWGKAAGLDPRQISTPGASGDPSGRVRRPPSRESSPPAGESAAARAWLPAHGDGPGGGEGFLARAAGGPAPARIAAERGSYSGRGAGGATGGSRGSGGAAAVGPDNARDGAAIGAALAGIERRLRGLIGRSALETDATDPSASVCEVYS